MASRSGNRSNGRKTNGGNGKHTAANPPDEDSIRVQVFQDRADSLQKLDKPHYLANNNLFVLIGPPSAGKSTVQRQIDSFVKGCINAEKDQTREMVTTEDPWRNRISKREFKKRRKDGIYIFHYTERSKDSEGKHQDFYGFQERCFINTLKAGDALIAFNNPIWYNNFMEGKHTELIKKYANIIPIVLSTEQPEDLTTRLNIRLCNEREKKRRLKDATERWKGFKNLYRTIDHVIMNNTPKKLRDIPLNEDVPPEAEVNTYKKIDETTKKVAAIIDFYKRLRRTGQMSESEGLDVHGNFLDWIVNSFFGADYSTVFKALEGKKDVPLKGSAELIERVKKNTGGSAQVEYIFEHLAATENRMTKEGVIAIRFNDAINKENLDVGKKILEEMLPPQYGYWSSSKTRRLSLTDIPNMNETRDVYAIDLKLLSQ